MKVVVYIDVFFLINMIMNFSILYCEKMLFHLNSRWYRLAIGSGIGSLGAVFFIMKPCVSLIIKGICLYGFISILMVIVSFGYGGIKNFVKKVVAFYGLSFFIGGMFTFLTQQFSQWSWGNEKREVISFKKFIVVSIVVLIVIPLWMTFIKKEKQKQDQYYQVQLVYKKRKLDLVGFYDTGNCLRHWLTKQPVVVAEGKYIEELFSEEEKEDISAYMQAGLDRKILKRVSTARLTIIPYHSLGKSHGILIGITLDNVIIKKGNQKKENPNTIVALYEEKISVDGEYHMILHGDLLKCL